MNNKTRKLSGIFLAAAALSLGLSAQAQSTSTTTTTSTGMSGSSYGASSWYAPAGGRYIGFNAGRSDFAGGCGLGAFDCDDSDTSYNLYAGGMWNNNFGVEVGMTDFGRINRAGGLTKAYGFNVSLVGRAPLTESFSVFGKLGTIYGRTDVSTQALSGVSAGKDDGWGSTYGVGLNFDINQQLAAVVQWDQSNMHFVGGKEHINTTSVGLKYRF